MKNHHPATIVAILLGLAFFTGTALAQVPNLINYQGRVAVGTTNFNGTGSFKFALVNATGTTTYWSNNGSSSAGSQPTAAVSLAVTKGLYSVLLGDTSPPLSMTAIPVSVFTNADVRLRVWFNDGTNGFQLLTPDQRIAAVGYAMMAGGVSLPATTSATTGVLTLGGSPFLHGYGSGNTFVGSGAGNFSMSGYDNMAIGSNALDFNTTGSWNTASGHFALYSNTTGHQNTATGGGALFSNTTGSYNTASGMEALRENDTGSQNTAIGYHALISNTTGSVNAASGAYALNDNTTGSQNTASGGNALASNTTGYNNTASGAVALNLNTTGHHNTSSGSYALRSNVTGYGNTATGAEALEANTTGLGNTAIGYKALRSATGHYNTGIGQQAGENLTTGRENIYINNVGGVGSESYTIRLGFYQQRAFIAGIRGATTGAANGIPVLIDSNGQLGTVSSSRRYKEDISDMGDASARLQSLRPVTFRYKKPFADGGKPLQFGLIAEEVAEVFPELAVFNGKGQPETVKYQDLTPLLLNEVQKLRAEKDDLRARIEKLEAFILKGAAQ